MDEEPYEDDFGWDFDVPMEIYLTTRKRPIRLTLTQAIITRAI